MVADPSTPRGQGAVPRPHTCTTLEYLKLVRIAVLLSLKPETFRLVQRHQVGRCTPLTNAHPAFSMSPPFSVEARQMPCTAALEITGEVELSLQPRCCNIGRIEDVDTSRYRGRKKPGDVQIYMLRDLS